MPSRDEHLSKADRNDHVLTQMVENQESPEWAVTVAFYRAVHLVEAWFALRAEHHRNHRIRNNRVNAELPAVARAYMQLYRWSRISRYDPDGLVTWEDYERLAEGLTRIEARVRADLR